MRYRITFMACLSVILLMGLVFLQGCKKAEAKDGENGEGAAGDTAGTDDPVDFFIALEDKLSENSLTSIAIIEIVDPRENDEHRIRNVRQATINSGSGQMTLLSRPRKG